MALSKEAKDELEVVSGYLLRAARHLHDMADKFYRDANQVQEQGRSAHFLAREIDGESQEVPQDQAV